MIKRDREILRLMRWWLRWHQREEEVYPVIDSVQHAVELVARDMRLPVSTVKAVWYRHLPK